MLKLMPFTLLLLVLATGCATTTSNSSLTPGRALSLAKEKLPQPGMGRAYGVEFKNGIWLVCLCSAQFITDGPSRMVVARVSDIDGTVEILKRLPASMGIVSTSKNDWARFTPGFRNGSTNMSAIKTVERR